MGESYHVFVGTLNREAPYFQGARGTGLAVFSFDEETLAVKALASHQTIENPTFLSVDTKRQVVYANSEIFGWNEGLVTALAFDPRTGSLAHINMQPSLGSITAHNAISRDGTRLFVVNYGLGEGGPDQSLVVYGIRSDGGLTPPMSSVRQTGTGPKTDRQERSHTHSVIEIADNLLLVADLGCDSLTSYRIEGDGKLTLQAVSRTKAGAGPRHMALDPKGRLLFVLNELDSTLASFAIDQSAGTLVQLDSKPTVPTEALEGNHCADVQISGDGQFLYASNRGHDSIAVFKVDPQSGKLDPIQSLPCGGSTPRNLALSPSGKHLFCANQNSDLISIFSRHPVHGTLVVTDQSIPVGTPMCVRPVAVTPKLAPADDVQ
ncbi:lactonase family protein [Pararhizobium gei]|uniref:lactonase family protein n=1 Tax=Pararhizobium gei TaxID=1395951 RepID=UPI0023DC94F1|nr:lactonase family protein [Rhizobium gei]